MKTNIQVNHKIIGILLSIIMLFVVDAVEAQYSAEAVAHSKRATRRRTAVVVSSATHAKDEQAAAAEQSSTSTTTTEAAPATDPAPEEVGAVGEPAPASEPAPAPAPQATSSGAPLPIGSVVTTLPGGCEPTPVDNVQYYHCGADYYRVAYQGNNLVYVTTELPN